MGYLLSDIVNEKLVELAHGQNSQEARIYQFALSGLRELHMDIAGLIKVVELTINDNDTVDLPNDFLSYSKIGLCGDDGRIHTLGLDNDLCMNQTFNNCGVPIKHSQLQSSDGFVGDGITGFGGWGLNTAFFGLYNNPGSMFGLGGGNNQNGYFRYNRATNQLLLANLWCHTTSIILEYISDVSVSAEGDFIVHPYEIQTIKDWISWKYCYDDRNVSANDKGYKERVYWNSRRQMNNRYNSSTIAEWGEALRKSNTAAVRF